MGSSYAPTIGLEIHAELKTQTKMFCNSKNDPDEKRANVNVCPICMAHPGTLPVINKQAVHHVVRIGTALGGTIASYTEFDRKNYFYPDLPKGYQISQYEYPIITGGSLNGKALTRIHLEEDAARSQHGDTGHSLIDFNRAGVPLMELVTEPVMKNADEAVAFAKELQLLLRTLGASDANLEKGEMRFDVNISVSQDGSLGTKVEIKNVNSFRSLERAIFFETKRQTELLEKGEKVVQETRGWDDVKEVTSSQRLKESSHDYRYFPDPDLPKLTLSEVPGFNAEEIKTTLPELPWERRSRYIETLGMKGEDAELFVTDESFGKILEEKVLPAFAYDSKRIQLAVNYLTSDVRSYAKDDSESVARIAPGFVELITMIANNEVSSRGGKDILAVMIKEGGSSRDIATAKGLFQKSNEEELIGMVREVLKEHAAVANDFKAGKQAALGFLVGQGMRKSGGSANPGMLSELFKKEIGV